MWLLYKLGTFDMHSCGCFLLTVYDEKACENDGHSLPNLMCVITGMCDQVCMCLITGTYVCVLSQVCAFKHIVCDHRYVRSSMYVQFLIIMNSRLSVYMYVSSLVSGNGMWELPPVPFSTVGGEGVGQYPYSWCMYLFYLVCNVGSYITSFCAPQVRVH